MTHLVQDALDLNDLSSIKENKFDYSRSHVMPMVIALLIIDIMFEPMKSIDMLCIVLLRV